MVFKFKNGPLRSFSQPQRAPGIGKIQMIYEPTITHFSLEQKQFGLVPNHPSRAKHEAFLAALPKDTLRWQFMTRPCVKQLPKAFQREALKQKWRKNFMLALADAGYVKDGRKYPSFEPGLVGTLEALVFDGEGWKEEDSYCRSICGSIIAAVEKKQAGVAAKSRGPSRKYFGSLQERNGR
jgi:hypothetical protein